jgi:hypothetical protein
MRSRHFQAIHAIELWSGFTATLRGKPILGLYLPATGFDTLNSQETGAITPSLILIRLVAGRRKQLLFLEVP